MNFLVDQYTIGDIPVLIFEEHHHVLEAWAEPSNAMPYVLTFDHHTDTHEAFQAYACKHRLDPTKIVCDIKVDLKDSILKLKHDEHIDAAIKANIINKALIVSYDSGKYREGRIYRLREDNKYLNERIIINSPACLFDCKKMPHDDECILKQHENVIETKYLRNKIEIFEDVIPKKEWEQNYILDIDLDCFHTMKSISPNDISYFKELIKNAKMITIAKESKIVNTYKARDPQISSEKLLEKLLNLVRETVLDD